MAKKRLIVFPYTAKAPNNPHTDSLTVVQETLFRKTQQYFQEIQQDFPIISRKETKNTILGVIIRRVTKDKAEINNNKMTYGWGIYHLFL